MRVGRLWGRRQLSGVLFDLALTQCQEFGKLCPQFRFDDAALRQGDRFVRDILRQSFLVSPRMVDGDAGETSPRCCRETTKALFPRRAKRRRQLPTPAR